MAFLIHGRDSAEFVDTDHDLHETHQAYMDRWVPDLIARGPTLSDDGSRHTGSVHVLDTRDLQEAERFAFDEPYARAGWYSDIAVLPFESLVAATMWDRPRPAAATESSFVLVSWAPPAAPDDLVAAIRPRVAGPDAAWPFVGVLADQRGAPAGLSGSVDLPPAAARSWLRETLAALGITPTDISVHRWERGGRR